MKVAILNINEDKGGASIACSRVYASLKKFKAKEDNFDYFVQQSTSSNSHIIGNSAFNNLRFLLDRLSFIRFSKDRTVRFAFSAASVGIRNKWLDKLKEYDIIHIHWFNFGFLSLDNLRYIKSFNKPTVFTMHDMWLFTGGCHYNNICRNFENACGNCNQFLSSPKPNDLSSQVLKKKIRLFENWDNLYFVGSSEWMKNEALSSKLLRNKRVYAIPTPVETDVFKKKSKIEARHKLNIKSDKPVILFAAMNFNDSRKGGDLLKKSLDRLVERGFKFRLLVVGKYNEKIGEILGYDIMFTGLLKTPSEMAEAYNASDVFAIPSRQDNLPNTIMEAMACSTPCVGFHIGGIPEMIAHKQNGYVARQNDVEDFAEGIKWALDKENHERLSINARMAALENFSEKKIYASYNSFYKSIIKG